MLTSQHQRERELAYIASGEHLRAFYAGNRRLPRSPAASVGCDQSSGTCDPDARCRPTTHGAAHGARTGTGMTERSTRGTVIHRATEGLKVGDPPAASPNVFVTIDRS